MSFGKSAKKHGYIFPLMLSTNSTRDNIITEWSFNCPDVCKLKKQKGGGGENQGGEKATTRKEATKSLVFRSSMPLTNQRTGLLP